MHSITMGLIKEYDEFIIASETDLDGVITYASQGFCEISGYSEKELVGKSHNIVRDPKNDPEIFKTLWEKLKNNETVEIKRLSNKNKNGDIYYTKARFHPVFKDGQKIGYRSLRKDITDKIKLERIYQKMLKNNNK